MHVVGRERGPLSAGLLLIAHGSRDGGTRIAGRLAGILSGQFAETAFAVLRGAPSPIDALATMEAPLVHVVPLLATSGHIVRDVLPAMLPAMEWARLRLHPPIGSHPALAGLACEAVRRIMERHRLDPTETAILVVGHGNARDPASAEATRTLSRRLAASSCVAETGCLFLSQHPRVKDWRTVTGQPNVIVLPYLFSDGIHARIDLPTALAEGVDESGFLSGAMVGGRRLWLAPLLGDDPGLAALVLDLLL
jgi:sirohydrochlorin cobaltochelatase